MKDYGTKLFSKNDWYKAYVILEKPAENDFINNPFPISKFSHSENGTIWHASIGFFIPVIMHFSS